MTLSPSVKATNVSGSKLDYTVTVKNNDSQGCGATSFDLSGLVPAGWPSASFASSSLTLAAGASGQTTMSVSSPVGTSDGNYAIGASASGVNHASASGSGTYGIDATAPTAPTQLTVSTRRQGRKLFANFSWIAVTDSSGIASYEIFRNGSKLNSTTSTSYQDTLGGSSGTFTYQVRAIDGAGNASAFSNSVTVTK